VDLGLHRDASTWMANGRPVFSPMELQARKQIWWAIQSADKYVYLPHKRKALQYFRFLTHVCRYSAVYMGRPPAINEASYDTLLPEVCFLPSRISSVPALSFVPFCTFLSLSFYGDNVDLSPDSFSDDVALR
jgi:hypothetical protein